MSPASALAASVRGFFVVRWMHHHHQQLAVAAAVTHMSGHQCMNSTAHRTRDSPDRQPDGRTSNQQSRSKIMKTAIFKGKGNIAVEERPKPAIGEPTDAIVRVVLA